jgi:hypothetical protein
MIFITGGENQSVLSHGAGYSSCRGEGHIHRYVGDGESENKTEVKKYKSRKYLSWTVAKDTSRSYSLREWKF